MDLLGRRRFDRAREIAALDAESFEGARRIMDLLTHHEFPWDIHEALSFALFRTYAVPSIGSLLFRTGEFTERTQKRYDDTALILDAILEHGMDDGPGRDALRRMNRMHGSYPISNDDLRYVLATFVITPTRWIEQYGWRRLTPHEIRASVVYFTEVGRHMGIKDLPATYEGYEDCLDSYEREHFPRRREDVDAGGRAVADATLDLFATFPPNQLAPKGFSRIFAYAIMDDALLDALGYPRPHPLVRALAQGAVKARARVVRLLPPRDEPLYVRQRSTVRGYPYGFRVSELGTFPTSSPSR